MLNHLKTAGDEGHIAELGIYRNKQNSGHFKRDNVH